MWLEVMVPKKKSKNSYETYNQITKIHAKSLIHLAKKAQKREF